VISERFEAISDTLAPIRSRVGSINCNRRAIRQRGDVISERADAIS